MTIQSGGDKVMKNSTVHICIHPNQSTYMFPKTSDNDEISKKRKPSVTM